MKKYLFVLSIATALVACGSNAAEKKADTGTPSGASSQPTSNDLSKNPDYQKGLELVAKSDCFTCHKISEKLIGPSYQDVAAKYENNDANIKLLAEKVVKGGQGVWGQVPMTAHPAINNADAEQMIKYILLLKTK